MKAIIFDLDGTLFASRNFWTRMHHAYGTWEEGKILTEKYLKDDFEKLVETVVLGLWKGKKSEKYYSLIETATYHPGVKELFAAVKRKKYLTAIISSAPLDLARKVQKDFGIDEIYANEIEIKNGVFTGKFYACQDYHSKDTVLRRFCDQHGFSPKDCIVVGDGENDIPMFKIAGKAIGFNILPEEKELIGKHCDVIIMSDDLRKIIPHL